MMPEMRTSCGLYGMPFSFPVTTLVLLLSFSAATKNMQLSLAFVVVLADGIFVTMIIIAPPPINYSYYAGLMLIFIFGYSFIRARFIWATISGWFIVICYEIGATGNQFNPSAHSSLTTISLFFISAKIIGMFFVIPFNMPPGEIFFLPGFLKE
ncbi:MAG: hypothetical protein U5K27_02620 [Desulfotignum sp.]|nr:hypothetical protein [Desulfotignum sp.]